MKNGPGDPAWGWKMLMEDLRNPKGTLPPQQPEQPMQQVQQTQPPITNIVNYPPIQVPMTLKRFNFASIYAIITMVIFLIILGVVLWRLGTFEHILSALGL